MDIKIKSLVLVSSICGASLAMSAYSLFTDYLGKEMYSQYILNHWVSSKISVPIALLSIVLSIAMLYLCYKVELVIKELMKDLKKK